MDPEVSRPARPESLYFAYGSNLHLAQMARRCPESRYVGTALLHGHRWQINQRGFANIIPSSSSSAADGDDVVAGLCFLLSAKDEARLDVSEGVAIEAYGKELVDVELFVARAAVVGRRVAEVVGRGLVRGVGDGGREVAPVVRDRRREQVPEGAGRGDVVRALVYASRRYVDEGAPREEYIDRMNLGIADALMLGVAEEYAETHIRKYIPLR